MTEEHLLSAELRQAHGTALAVRHDDIGRDAAFEERAPHNRDLAKAPHVRGGIGDALVDRRAARRR